MIISHLHKFIFVPIPKTGTHSVRYFLRPILGEYDWEQCTLFEKKSFPIKEIASIQHGHIPMSVIQSVLPKEIWMDYYSFAFVRHPYERFLSYCYFINRMNSSMEEDPDRTIQEIIDNHDFHNNPWLMAQSKYTHHNQEKLVNYIGSCDRIETDIHEVMKKCDVGEFINELPTINVSNRQKSVSLSVTVKKRLCQIYSEDFTNFSFKM